MNRILAIYCRISRPKEEGKDKSINDQKLLGIAKANELGYDYELYIDEGLSAASGDINGRPEFKRLLDDMKEGKLHAIYAIDQSRFERHPGIHHAFVADVKQYIKEYYTDIDGLVNLSDPQVELMMNMTSVFNQYHVTMTRHKVISVLKRNALDGKSHGISAYGYTGDKNGYLIIQKEEAKIIKRIYDLAFEGYGTRAIANQLNDDNIPTRYNKIGKGVIRMKNRYTGEITQKDKKSIQWAQNTIRSILRNSIYKGKWVRKHGVITVPAIIPETKWDKVQSALPNRTHVGKNKYNYLLKGKLRCGKCGRNYYGRTRESKRDHTYICSSRRDRNGNCGNRGINIDRLDDLIWFRIINGELFLKLLKRDFAFSDSKINNLQSTVDDKNKALKKLEGQRQRLITAYSNGAFDENDLQIQLDEVTTNRNKIMEDLEVLVSNLKSFKHSEKIISKYHEFQKKLNYFKDKLTFDEKQAIVSIFIENVVIHYDEIENQYELDIYYRIHPSEFDKDYPWNYNTDEKAFIPKIQKSLAPTFDNTSSEMV